MSIKIYRLSIIFYNLSADVHRRLRGSGEYFRVFVSVFISYGNPEGAFASYAYLQSVARNAPCQQSGSAALIWIQYKI